MPIKHKSIVNASQLVPPVLRFYLRFYSWHVDDVGKLKNIRDMHKTMVEQMFSVALLCVVAYRDLSIRDLRSMAVTGLLVKTDRQEMCPLNLNVYC